MKQMLQKFSKKLQKFNQEKFKSFLFFASPIKTNLKIGEINPKKSLKPLFNLYNIAINHNTIYFVKNEVLYFATK